MSDWTWILIGLGATLLVYAGAVLVLVLRGSNDSARALARFIPDCIVLFRRLLGDPRVPRGRKILIWLAIGYLALPIDLVPDFIPVAGQLDDVIVVAFVLRVLVRGGGPELLEAHWPGPDESLRLVRRAAFGGG